MKKKFILLAIVATFIYNVAEACTMSGTKVIGPTGDYSTIASAMSALTANGLSGPVVLELQAGYTGEAYPITIGSVPCVSSINTITIRPQSTMTIVGTGAPMFDLNGAKYVIIDGRVGSAGTTKALTISNTSTTGQAIRFINDATSDTIRYCTIQGVNTSQTSGVVLFSTTTGTTGNDNNAIDNCDILDGASLPVNCIYASGTTTTGRENSGNTISNCNIANYFSANFPSTGLLVQSGNTSWTISGNNFYQSATRNTTSGTLHRAIYINNTTGNGFAVTGNTIGYASGSATGNYTIGGGGGSNFHAITLAVGTSVPSSLQGNTITNISYSNSSNSSSAGGMLCGINVIAGSVNIGTTTANVIGAATGTGAITATSLGSGAIVGISTSASSSQVRIENNIIGAITALGTSTSVSVGIQAIQITGSNTVTVTNNTIGSASTANSINSATASTSAIGQAVYGINASMTAPITITNNTIANLSGAATGTATSGTVGGIFLGGQGGGTISGNSIHDLTGANTNGTTSFPTSMFGIGVTNNGVVNVRQNTIYTIANINTTSIQRMVVAGIELSTANNPSISGNKIYDLRNACTFANTSIPPQVNGIICNTPGGTGVTIANNMISLGNAQTTNTAFSGIINTLSSSASTIRAYYNTVNIEGTVSSGALFTSCFTRGDWSGSATPVDVRNNIFVNNRTGGTGKHYAVVNAYNTTSPTGWNAGVSNYNILNTANAATLGYWSGDRTFAAWKTTSANDSDSYTALSVAFTNTATGDLHLDLGTTVNGVESKGSVIPGITTDFDGDARPGPAGSVNGGGSAPDVGADEFDGVPAPAITGTFTLLSCGTTTLNNPLSGGIWSSSNTSVATVGSTTGVVTGISGGTATIVYAASAGYANVVVTVNAPAISSVSPASANPGSSVTITGIGFSATASDNIVYFGATRATVTAASSNSLTATMPVGATFMPVTVNNLGCGTAYANVPFLPTYDNSAYQANHVNFAPKVDFVIGTPHFSAIGDLDNDGKADLVVARESSVGNSSISIYRNISTSGSFTSSSFASPVTFFTPGYISNDVDLGDIDGDGKLDIVVANGTNGNFSVFRNIASPGSITSASFAGIVTYSVSLNGNLHIKIADMDADGKPDVVVTNSDDIVSIFRNKATIGSINASSFAAGVSFNTGATTDPWGVEIGDIDGDGKPDIVVALESASRISIYRNTSMPGTINTGSFASRVDFTGLNTPRKIALADIDADGKLDVIVSCFGLTASTGRVSILRNTATPGSITTSSLASRVDFFAGSYPYGLQAADFDGDGKPDVAVVCSLGVVSVLRNTATTGIINSSSMASASGFPIFSTGRGLSAGDLDGDGKPDLVVTDPYNGLSVLRNNPYTPAAPITGTTSACVGATTTLADTSSGGTWSSSAAGVASVGSASGIVTGVSSGTATISYITPTSFAVTTVTVNAVPSAISGSSSVCVGSSITLSNSTAGGTWSGSNTSIASTGTTGFNSCAVTGISSGVVTISYVLSATGCSATKAVTVNPLPAAITGTTLLCISQTSTLTSAPGGGTWASSSSTRAPINSSTGVVSGAQAGTANITYTLPTGCRTTTQVTVTPVPTVYNMSGGGSRCPGGEGVTIGLSNSTTGISYQLYSGSTAVGSTVTGTGAAISFGVFTAAGTYSAVATAPAGCNSNMSGSAVVVINPTPSVSVSTTDVSCNGGSNGSISTSVTGGTPSYNYVWSNESTSANLTGVEAGTYTVTVTDANGCVTSTAATVAQPSALELSVPATDVLCNGGSTGSVMVVASGGTSPYTGTGTFSGLSAGSYSYTVTDANGCSATVSTTVSEPSVLSATATVTDVLCHGGNTGSVIVAASGGTSPYTGTGTFSGLSEGSYSYTVTDANGCITTVSATVNEPSMLSASTSVTDVLCHGGSTGSTTVAASGGTSPYTGTGTFSGLSAGSYSYTVTDANGCSATVSATVNEPSMLSASSAVTNVLCYGGSTGSVAVAASGGTSPYTGTGTFSGLSEGSYSYTVTDANGCITTVSATVNEPSMLSASASVTDVLCHGGSTGSTTVAASGGTSPYSGTGTFSGLSAGSYSYTVTDANGCSATVSATVNEPSMLSASSTVTNVLCYGGSTGSVTITASGGVSPYTGTGTYSGLSVGSYSYTVTDANGCTATGVYSISQPTAFTGHFILDTIRRTASCPDGLVLYGYDSTISVVVSGGTPSYTYSWGAGTSGCSSCTSAYLTAFSTTYSVTVTDAQGCTLVVSTNCGRDVRCSPGHNDATKVAICHKGRTICVDSSAVANFVAKGSYPGPCGMARQMLGNDSSPVAEYSEDLQVAAYPNPFSDEIRVNISGGSSNIADIALYDMTGKLLEYVKDKDIAKAIVVGRNIAQGMYMLEVKFNGVSRKIKVTKL